jgi:SAM-dependent methyltransferase
VKRTGCRLVGVDIVPEGISCAAAEAEKRGLADRANFIVVAAGEQLPFDDGGFDAVMSICHFPDRHFALRDWARLVKPRGRIVFTDPFDVTGPLTGPRCDGSRRVCDTVGGLVWDVGCGDDRQDTPGVFFAGERARGDPATPMPQFSSACGLLDKVLRADIPCRYRQVNLS